MIFYNVSIPEHKQSFFKEFLDIIGATYQENTDDGFILSEAQKNILDSQNNLEDSLYQEKDEFLAELKQEYGL